MPINYRDQSQKYRPTSIKTLLVGEAPPASGKAYFYFPKPMSNARPIQNDNSLPATIFHHYFQTRPSDCEDYIEHLRKLQKCKVFLIDICDDPITVRRCPEGRERIIQEIPKLRDKMKERAIEVLDQDIIFLLARKTYLQHIHQEFEDSRYITWKDFRMTPETCLGENEQQENDTDPAS
jgi:hypothetical protein